MTSQPASPTFAPNRPWDRNFYLLMVALCWLGVVMGFGGELMQRAAHHAKAFAPIVHVHAVVFVLWLALFTVQVLLIRSKKLTVHKKLGMALAWLAGLMVILGPVTALTVQHLAIGDPQADPAFLCAQLIDIVAFAGLTGAGLALRKKVSAHKRLILLGTVYITAAGFARWLADPIIGALGGPSFWHLLAGLYGGPIVLVALVGIYDLATRRRLHPAYVAGAAYALAAQMLAVSLYINPAWLPVSKRIIAVWPW